MKSYKVLNVFIDHEKVGTLAVSNRYIVAFEYDSKWLDTGFSISPFSLPLEKRVFVPKGYEPFEGLFGVFSDSLPDGWGRLLVDRMLAKNGVNSREVDSLNRLAIVGDSGMGALCYKPIHSLEMESDNRDLDELAVECNKLFDSKISENLDLIFKMAGSSGGARPKVFYKIENEEWIVKFPSSIDEVNIGEQEYKYALCAKKCNIEMPKIKLLPSKLNSGYFAVKRFDREGENRIHMITAGALLETSHRIPNLDYNILMQLTMKLTCSYIEVEKLFRLMCFNIFAHNRDDHSKNFSFLYKEGHWSLSPAYDLTYSNSIGGEHATTVNGNGANPDMSDIMAVAAGIKMDQKKAKKIADEIYEIVKSDLKEYIG